jgi:hypothetical protein
MFLSLLLDDTRAEGCHSPSDARSRMISRNSSGSDCNVFDWLEQKLKLGYVLVAMHMYEVLNITTPIHSFACARPALKSMWNS